MPPTDEGKVFNTEEFRGENGYRFRIYSRPATVAVYAFAGILNTQTEEFRPYVMGLTRGIVVGPNETVTNVQIFMTRQLSTSLTVWLEDAPLADRERALTNLQCFPPGAEADGTRENMRRQHTADAVFDD